MVPLAVARLLVAAAKPFMVVISGAWVRHRVAEGSLHPAHASERVIIACNHRTAYDLIPFFKLCQPSVLLDKGCAAARAFPQFMYQFRISA